MADSRRRTPRQERARFTVEAILDATAQLLVRDGYAALTTKAVAERAGVSVGTLYQYFPNKEVIVDRLVDRIADEQIGVFGSQLASLTERDAEMEDGIRVLLDALIAVKRVEPELSRVLMTQAPTGRKLEANQAWRRRCRELVLAAMYTRRDRFRDADLELMVYVAVTAMFAVFDDATAYRTELLGSDALRDEMAELVIRYFSPD